MKKIFALLLFCLFGCQVPKQVGIAAIAENPLFSVNLAASTGIIQASPSTILSALCINRSGSNAYLQLFNQVGSPSNGTTANFQALIPPGEVIVGTDFFQTSGMKFLTGLVWGASTTNTTLTAGTAANFDCIFGYQ
jgi:hypothetical protein